MSLWQVFYFLIDKWESTIILIQMKPKHFLNNTDLT